MLFSGVRNSWLMAEIAAFGDWPARRPGGFAVARSVRWCDSISCNNNPVWRLDSSCATCRLFVGQRHPRPGEYRPPAWQRGKIRTFKAGLQRRRAGAGRQVLIQVIQHASARPACPGPASAADNAPSRAPMRGSTCASSTRASSAVPLADPAGRAVCMASSAAHIQRAAQRQISPDRRVAHFLLVRSAARTTLQY